MQSVRKLDNNNANIVCNCKEHFAQIFGLSVFFRQHVGKIAVGQLGNAVHHSGNVLAEHLCNFFNGDIVPILNRIMKQTRNDRVCIHVHIEQNERNGFGMNIIRFLRFAFLVSMNRFCKINCLY